MVNRKKHVLFIVENNPVPHDVRVWAEACEAKANGYDVSVISPKNQKANQSYEKIDGIEIYRHFIPFEAHGKAAFIIEYANAIFWEILLSIWIFLRKPFQIIHSANPPDHVFLIAILYKLFGVKFVFDHHDISPENYIAKFNRKDLLYKILVHMEKMTFASSDAVISTNNSYKQIAINRGMKDPNEVFILRNGPNLSKVKFPEPNPVLKNGFDYLIAYVGVIGNQEGIDVLLRIIDDIVNRQGVKNIKTIIIGTGPHLKAMIELSKKMNLEKYVEFTGYIPYWNFYEILSTSDLCVNPEYCNDFTDKSTMLKIMDYMTFGKPIVQFRTTEGEVTAGDSAVYVDDNDESAFSLAVLDLLKNSSKRKKMGEIGKSRVNQHLNWDKQKKQLLKVYQYLETV